MDNKSADENGATPRTDRETYTVKQGDIGFRVTPVSCAQILERELTASRARITELERGIGQQKEDFASSMRGFIKLKSESDAELTALRADNTRLVANALSLESEIEELRGRLEVANLTYLGAASERDALRHDIEPVEERGGKERRIGRDFAEHWQHQRSKQDRRITAGTRADRRGSETS